VWQRAACFKSAANQYGLLLLLLARSQREHHCPMTFSSGLHDQCVGASYTRDQQCRQPPLQTDRVDRRFVQRRIYVVVDN